MIDPVAGQNYFYDVEGKLLFPFYWTQMPRKYDEFPVEMLTEDEVSALNYLNDLPRGIPARLLVLLPKSPRPRFDLDGWMAQQGLNLSYRQALRNRALTGTSAEDHRNVAIDLVPGTVDPCPVPRDVVLPDPNAKTKKDKGKRKADDGATDTHRAKHRRAEIPSTDLAIPSAIVSKDFLSEEVRPTQMMSSDLLFVQGHRMLDFAAPSA
ncbi:uncharacterized protein LOC114915059 [Cajanus cajan]|uniref:uncharacterized protein LOC114915059 n=1 Tax=Cajanus cajan TaxID=3821 RepID=UPI0010FAF4F9|nr:uncharacterized protein LOC114915059 [Cajanus cajan]